MEQVGTALRSQVQQAQQLGKVVEPQRHHHHAGKAALCIGIAAAERQQVAIGVGAFPGVADRQVLLVQGAVQGHKVASRLLHIGLLRVQPHQGTAPRVQHGHAGNHRNAQRMVKQHARTQTGLQGHHLRAGQLLHHADHRPVDAAERARHALLQRAHQVGVGGAGKAPFFVVQGPEGAAKQRTDAQRQQHHQRHQAVGCRQAQGKRPGHGMPQGRISAARRAGRTQGTAPKAPALQAGCTAAARQVQQLL